ncbi:MAG: peroxiredoxin [Gemmatimonas sp.]|nr:peroxiredoxin [Gemmatimonas sp.]
MGRYFATITWNRGSDEFLKQKYSRGHTWHFDEGVSVPASASPQAVPAPLSVAAAVDPEEALVAALSSCHMLFALSLLSKHGAVVESYEDAAEGVMEKRADGKTALTRVTLKPVVTVSANAPDADSFAKLHHEAHEECYIANSVNFPVLVEPTLVLR